jgi:hypothetical protein
MRGDAKATQRSAQHSKGEAAQGTAKAKDRIDLPWQSTAERHAAKERRGVSSQGKGEA